MDFLKLIPSGDNFFKLLFLLGLGLVIFAFVYPEIKRTELNELILEMNHKSSLLENEVERSKELSIHYDKVLDKLEANIKLPVTKANDLILKKLLKESDSISKLVDINLNKNATSLAEQKYITARYDLYNSNLEYYNGMAEIINIFGIGSLIIGFIGWVTIEGEKSQYQKLQIDLLKRQLNKQEEAKANTKRKRRLKFKLFK